MYQETVNLSHLPPEGLRIERHIQPNAWKIVERDWESKGELVFDVFIKGNSRKVTVKGSFEGGAVAYCHRCLRQIDLILRRKFNLTYLPPDPARFAKEEVELTSDELEVSYLDKDNLAIHDILREQIYLAVPMKFLCSMECLGLCPRCGANLNEVKCNCATEEIDPRWAPLRANLNERK
jgi:uncharacterized protein